MSYKVIRFYADAKKASELVKRGLTRAEAQAHCKSPLASSQTNNTPEGKARTREHGDWFEGFEAE